MRIFLLALVFASLAQAWDGPPPPIGGGLINAARPSTYIDGVTSGLTNTPFNSRIRSNVLLSQGDKDTYQLNFKSEIFQLPNPVPLAGAFVNTPTNLWTEVIGGTFTHKMDSSNDWGLILSAGSDSDIPFNTINEVDYNATGIYHWQKDPLHAWIFLLNYSKTRSFAPGVPLPGVGYFVVDLENHTQIFYGIPFFLGWDFAKDWKVTASYFLLTTINTDVSYRISPIFKVHGGFQWVSQTWLRSGRSDPNNHIIFDQKKLVSGISSSLGENWFLDLDTGFVFDQRIAEANSILSQNIAYNFLSASLTAQLELAYKF